MEIKGILLDKDGTLIDFYEVWGKAAGPVAASLLKEYGVMVNDENKRRLLKCLGVEKGIVDSEGPLAWKSYRGIAEDIRPLLEELSGKKADTGELEKQLTELFFKETVERRESYPVFTDVKKMLEKLNQMGIQTGLATTDEPASTRHCMEKLGVTEYISFWGTAGTDLPVKPDARLIEMAAQTWGIRREEIAVVGDTPHDMQFAKNGGALAVGVLSGTGKKESMKQCADVLIFSVVDLVHLMRKCNRIEEAEGI